MRRVCYSTALVRLACAGVFVYLSCCSVTGQSRDTILGVKLQPEVRSIVREIELKTHKPLRALLGDLDEFQLGSSFIDDETGTATIYAASALEDDPKKLEAVITHELLHLKLRVNGFPTFIFSPTVRTARGRAIDVEQEHVNDLLSIIEHRTFKADMEKFGLYRLLNLAGDTAADARARKGDEDGQADAINYARALLEYPDQRDAATVKQLFTANGWDRALKEGSAIADIISRSEVATPAAVESVFRRCLSILFPPPKPSVVFIFNVDPTNKYFKRLVINLSRGGRKRAN